MEHISYRKKMILVNI